MVSEQTAQTPVPAEGGGTTESSAEPPAYHVRLEADGQSSQDVPVYDDETSYMLEFERYRQQLRSSLHDDAQVLDRRDSRIQWIQYQLDDGRTIWIPFEETPISPRLQ